jgi:sodium transport system permease protein
VLSLKSEFVFSRIFPVLIVMMSLTGALYPAIDVCAGEKERGTMETLLISPASRSEIVAGKFLTVWLFSTISAVLNLGSLGFTAWQFGSALAIPGSDFEMPVPSASALAWGFVLLLPLAGFFSAVCVALAVYARSTKEGQYFLMPLTIVTLLLTVVSLLPGSELTPFYSLIPVTGAALLLQELMNAQTSEQIPWLYLGPVLLPLAVYCYLALQWAIHQFNSEDVLFREAERLDLGLWLKRLLRDKEPLPSPGEAVACFVIILVLHWYLGLFTTGLPVLQAVGVLQIAGIAMPPVLMALLLTSRPLATLRLRWPRWPSGPANGSGLSLLAWLGLSVFLGLAVHGPLIYTIEAIVARFPAIAEHLQELEKRLKLDQALWLQLLMLALLPPICEELAFRGFILRGLGTRLSGRNAILISSLLFAFAHGDPFRLVPTFLLGLVLALLATRSGSLLPGIIFHSVHNGLAVCSGWIKRNAEASAEKVWWPFTDVGLYGWPMLIGSGTVILLIVVWLARQPAVQDDTGES